ncbi:MAG: hypothetical protein VB078_11565 [Clostridiaceae bacterium]|nr:hypothetical protein [Clostridiaceae bacterium]
MLALAGTLFIALTIALAAINIRNWQGLTFAAVLCIIWAEIALFGGLILIDRLSSSTAQVLFRSGASIVAAVYAFMVFSVSLLFMLWMKQSTAAFTTIQLTLFVIASVLFLLFWFLGKSVKIKNDKVSDSAASIHTYCKRLQLLANNKNLTKYESILNKMAEDLIFTDISSSVDVDNDIEAAISALEVAAMAPPDQPADQIDLLCQQANYLISKRKINAAKRGGI